MNLTPDQQEQIDEITHEAYEVLKRHHDTITLLINSCDGVINNINDFVLHRPSFILLRPILFGQVFDRYWTMINGISYDNLRKIIRNIFNFEACNDDVSKWNVVVERIASLDRDLARIQEQLFDDEKNIDDEKAEASGDDVPLGKIAFSPNRIDDVPREKNTSIEDDLFHDLAKHFRGSSQFNDDSAKLMKQFLVKKQYTKIFHEPDEDVIYRGIGAGEKWLKTALGNVRTIPGDEGSATGKFVFTPLGNRQTSSWTKDYEEAVIFSRKGMDDEKFCIIMHAAVEDNTNKFVAGPDGLYYLDIASRYENEEESIGIGTISVFKIEWALKGAQAPYAGTY